MSGTYLVESISPYATATRATNTFTTKQDVTPSFLPVILGGKLQGGTQISMRASGRYSTTGTPNLNLGFWFGTRAAAITGDIALSSTITTATATLWPWDMWWEGVCTAPGISGTLVGMGGLKLGASLTTFNTEVPIPITDALCTVTMDTTIERAIGVSATWSASSASNEIRVYKHWVLINN
jgi:hypothetical protein